MELKTYLLELAVLAQTINYFRVKPEEVIPLREYL
jgi:hypothetical protein